VSQSSKQFLMIIERQIVEFTKLNQTTGRGKFGTVSIVIALIKVPELIRWLQSLLCRRWTTYIK
jgi:hypothetical protein